MRVFRRCFWMLCVLGLVLPCRIQGQPSGTSVKTNRFILYPKKGESVSQLKERGVQNVEDYGSYWVVSATDAQAKDIARTFGDRATKADHLNHIELSAMHLDTTAGERPVPSELRQADTDGKRLRLIQFKGPVKPEWLEQIKSAGDLKLVNYIPNNAYVVWLDADTEHKVRGLLEPNGPLQWIGSYHPYYKIERGLLDVPPGQPGGMVTVRVVMVDDPEGAQAGYAIQALGTVGSSLSEGGQTTVQVDVPQSAISQIAQMPGVLWIEKVVPKHPLDEVQDLLLASQTNQLPSHAPIPRPSLGSTNYLDFLMSAVGGGLASFTDPATYPIVDIADTGLETGSTLPVSPVFYQFGNKANQSRVVYAVPPWLAGDPATQLGCNNRLNANFNGAADFFGHGTFVASIVAGYDNSPDEFVDCQVPIGNANPPNFVRRQDDSGFQLGMGVSPFGQIGIERIFLQNATIGRVNNVCTFTSSSAPPFAGPVTFCLNDFVSLLAIAYANGARIQNNSWDDIIDVQGVNGGAYTAESRTYDIAVRDALLIGSTTNVPGPSSFNQEFIVVFAAGNAGSVADPGGFGDIRVTAPATAKNVISVGASESVRLDLDDGTACGLANNRSNSFGMVSFSSLGPALDGRFKPEIVAPGSSIQVALDQLSLGINNLTLCGPNNIVPITPFNYDCLNRAPFISPLYTCSSGIGFGTLGLSSFASPAVSGGIQLLWWYFEHRLMNEEGQHLSQPSPAMAKAYLCNSARYLPLTNPQTGARDTLPSIAQGMGEMDLLRMFDGVGRVIRDESCPRAIDVALFSVNPAPQQTYFSQSGQSYEVSGEVLSNDLPFRVTVAWLDPPAAVGAFQTLVNNLDLEVEFGGQTYKGNVFSEDHSVPGGAFDGVNNMESVFLPSGGAVTAGAPYTVIVRAATIAGNGVPNVGSSLDQDFALVVYNSENPTDVPNPATNNSCVSAMPITSTPLSFTNTLTPLCCTNAQNPVYYGNVQPSPSAGRGGADEFFKLNLPTPGAVFTIDTAGSSFDTVLSVWRVQVVPQTVFVRSECGALVEVTSNNGGINPSRVTFTADGSNDYFIVVEPHNDGPGGMMVLNVNATAPAILVTPSPLLFPDQMAGLTGAVQAVTYQNNTAANIRISSVAITGSNAEDFVILSQSCAGNTLAPSQHCSVFIGFAPTTNGFRGAQLVINDDATGSPRVVPLGGNGLPAVPVACLNSNVLPYGTVTVGSTSAVQSVTITNCGSAALFITNMVVFGAAADYIISSNTCSGSSIPAGGTCMFGVKFAPTTSGSRFAMLAINNDGITGPNMVTLIGTGALPAPQLCFSGSLAFGGQTAGTTSTPQSVTITNCGTAVLHISSVTLTGPNAGEFILSGGACSGHDLGISNACTLGVAFAPTSATVEAASVIISNSSALNPAVVSLTGSGAGNQPNLWIGKTRVLKKFIGKNKLSCPPVFDPSCQNTDPISTQTLTLIARRGKKVVFYVPFQNNGNIPDSFTVSSLVSGSGGLTVSNFVGAIPAESMDITDAVGTGTYTTGALAARVFTDDTTMMRVEVTVAKQAPKGTNSVVITGVSLANPARTDTVRALIIVR